MAEKNRYGPEKKSDMAQQPKKDFARETSPFMQKAYGRPPEPVSGKSGRKNQDNPDFSRIDFAPSELT